MIKFVKVQKIVCSICLLLLVFNGIAPLRFSAVSDVNAEGASCRSNAPNEDTRGIMTNISLSIGSDMEVGNEAVWAKAHNDFTLGFSTIKVYVELYSSDTYQDDYSLMELESVNFSSDLNINQTLQTSAMINGRQRYWKAVMRYKFDKNEWVVKTTDTHLYDKDGYMRE